MGPASEAPGMRSGRSVGAFRGRRGARPTTAGAGPGRRFGHRPRPLASSRQGRRITDLGPSFRSGEPTGTAPVLDPTDEGALETERWAARGGHSPETGRNGQASHALDATAPAPYSARDPRGRVSPPRVAAEGGGPAAAGGVRQAGSAPERGEESDRRPEPGGELRLSGL